MLHQRFNHWHILVGYTILHRVKPIICAFSQESVLDGYVAYQVRSCVSGKQTSPESLQTPPILPPRPYDLCRHAGRLVIIVTAHLNRLCPSRVREFLNQNRIPLLLYRHGTPRHTPRTGPRADAVHNHRRCSVRIFVSKAHEKKEEWEQRAGTSGESENPHRGESKREERRRSQPRGYVQRGGYSFVCFTSRGCALSTARTCCSVQRHQYTRGGAGCLPLPIFRAPQGVGVRVRVRSGMGLVWRDVQG